ALLLLLPCNVEIHGDLAIESQLPSKSPGSVEPSQRGSLELARGDYGTEMNISENIVQSTSCANALPSGSGHAAQASKTNANTGRFTIGSRGTHGWRAHIGMY